MSAALPAQPNQSLMHGLNCLEALVAAGRPMGCRELAREMGLESTRVNRLLGTLAHLGLAARTEQRKYMVGSGVHVLAAMALWGSGLLQAALPQIRQLHAEWNLPVALGVLWGRQVCYLYHGRPGVPLEQGVGGHLLYPAERSSIGCVLMAQEAPRAVRQRFAAGPPPEGGWPALEQALDEVRSQGWCRAPGGSMAVAVGTPAVAGLSYAGAYRAETIPALVETLLRAAGAIVEALESHARDRRREVPCPREP